MKVKILNLKNEAVKEKELPSQFSEEIRPDIVKRAFLAIMANTRQPYGAKPEAGKRASAKLSRRRRRYKGSYGLGISRVPRKVMSRRGMRFSWVGAFAPGMRKGRRAHPPKAGKIWQQKINDKERRKAIRSAISATMQKEIVAKRGHIVPKSYPFIVDDRFEDVDKTKSVSEIMQGLGLKEELDRVFEKKIRAGKGKSRGRKYKMKVGPLIIVSKDCKLVKTARNIPGVEVVQVNNLNARLLAPGANIGRLCIWTEKAIDRLAKENLYNEKIR